MLHSNKFVKHLYSIRWLIEWLKEGKEKLENCRAVGCFFKLARKDYFFFTKNKPPTTRKIHIAIKMKKRIRAMSTAPAAISHMTGQATPL